MCCGRARRAGSTPRKRKIRAVSGNRKNSPTLSCMRTVQRPNCGEARGMRATGLSQRELATQLEQWLDLSSNKTIPISLLIMSRAFVLDTPSNPKSAKVEKGKTVAETVDKQTAVLRAVADEISSLSPEVVNEAVIATASNEEGKGTRKHAPFRDS